MHRTEKKLEESGPHRGTPAMGIKREAEKVVNKENKEEEEEQKKRGALKTSLC